MPTAARKSSRRPFVALLAVALSAAAAAGQPAPLPIPIRPGDGPAPVATLPDIAPPSPAPTPAPVPTESETAAPASPPAPPGSAAAPSGATNILTTPIVAGKEPPKDPGPPDVNHPAVSPKWDNGVTVHSADKGIVFHMGGTAQFDGAWLRAQSSLTAPGGVKQSITDGVTPRRIRFRADGTLWDDFDFFSEIEFINGYSPPGTTVTKPGTAIVPSVTEAWLQWKNIPGLGNFRIGSQKEPLGLEHLNSDRYLEFMERSFLQDLTYVSSFNNGFSPGMTLFRTWADKRVYSAVGLYKNINDPYQYATENGAYAATGRIAALPVWEDDGRTYWHVGGAMSHRDTVDGSFQARIRGQLRAVPGPFLPVYADTGTVDANSNDVYGLETLFVSGRLTVMSEYMANVVNEVSVKGAPAGNLLFSGWYAEALFFLTDDHRPYNPNSFTSGRVVPKDNFSWKNGGIGAWEVGVRYSYVSLNDGPVKGGVLNDVTIGLTWYLNPMARFYFNYEYLDRTDVSPALTAGVQHGFGTRFAIDF